MNAQSPHQWWSTLKSAAFELPPLVGRGGRLVCESVGKADLLSDHFNIKQSRGSVDLSLISHASFIVLSPLLSGRERSGMSS